MHMSVCARMRVHVSSSQVRGAFALHVFCRILGCEPPVVELTAAYWSVWQLDAKNCSGR
jgi:hypothetical protein